MTRLGPRCLASAALLSLLIGCGVSDSPTRPAVASSPPSQCDVMARVQTIDEVRHDVVSGPEQARELLKRHERLRAELLPCLERDSQPLLSLIKSRRADEEFTDYWIPALLESKSEAAETFLRESADAPRTDREAIGIASNLTGFPAATILRWKARLSGHPDVTVRCTWVDALIATPSRDTRDAVLEMLADRHQLVRAAAARFGSGRCAQGEFEELRVLVRALDDSASIVSSSAERSLDHIVEECVAPPHRMIKADPKSHLPTAAAIDAEDAHRRASWKSWVADAEQRVRWDGGRRLFVAR